MLWRWWSEQEIQGKSARGAVSLPTGQCRPAWNLGCALPDYSATTGTSPEEWLRPLAIVFPSSSACLCLSPMDFYLAIKYHVLSGWPSLIYRQCVPLCLDMFGCNFPGVSSAPSDYTFDFAIIYTYSIPCDVA